MGDEDKSFEASAEKLRRAKEEGQVAKSQDLSTALFLLVLFMLLFNMAPMFYKEIAALFILIFEQIPNATIEEMGWQFLAIATIRALVILVAPFFIVGAIVGYATNVGQVGPIFTTKPLSPKFDKLNPINGFKNIFSSRTVVELIKNILKISVLTYVAYTVFAEFLPQLLAIGSATSVFALMDLLGKVLYKFITMFAMIFLAIGGADFLYQRFKFLKDQKMSFKEVKDEYKNQEGDPHVKAMLRQRRFQMMQQRMLEAVPLADVVTTNPIHIAVALTYNAESMTAPKVVAKGTALFAEKIKEIARRHNIPVVENPPLAQTLFKLVDIEQEIPPSLYQTVAEILMFAWQAKGKNPPPTLDSTP
jgi:flagellar biosynthesis protein FlhB